MLQDDAPNARDLLERILSRVREFDALCGAEDYTDTGDAWDLFNWIAEQCEEVLDGD